MATQDYEYLCPKCSHVNSLEHISTRNMYREQFARCEHCNSELEIIPADGIGEQINLVVSLVPTEIATR